jgi:hypothetical protein
VPPLRLRPHTRTIGRSPQRDPRARPRRLRATRSPRPCRCRATRASRAGRAARRATPGRAEDLQHYELKTHSPAVRIPNGPRPWPRIERYDHDSGSNDAHDDDDDPYDIETARDIVRPHTTEPLYISSLPLFLSCVHSLFSLSLSLPDRQSLPLYGSLCILVPGVHIYILYLCWSSPETDVATFDAFRLISKARGRRKGNQSLVDSVNNTIS